MRTFNFKNVLSTLSTVKCVGGVVSMSCAQW